jgi:hypothetical protein
MAAPALVYKSFINIKNITKGVFSLNQGLNKSNAYTAKITKSASEKSNIKKKSILSDSILFKRKVESVRRKKQEGIVELSKVGAVFKSPARALSNAGEGILSRIMNFAGTIMAGWLVYNLPSISGMVQELIARVGRLTKILGGFLPNTGKIMNSFGDLLGSYTENFLSFDFKDSQDRVEGSMKNLQDSFSGMGASFDEALKLITTPLTEPLEGPGAPPLGTDYSEQPISPSVRQGGVSGVHKQALDIISGPESGGSYNAMNQGTINDRIVGSTLNSKTKIGKNLTDMTIGEVLQRQQWLMNGRNPQISNYGIYAAGRYQFIPNTLPGVIKSAGLSSNDIFNAKNQDLMAIALLKERGIQPWTIGGSRYSAKELEIVERARKTPVNLESQPPVAKPRPTPPPTSSKLQLIPQTGKGGFIQGGSGASGETTYATHFHIDLKTPNYTSEGLRRIREISFLAIKAMQGRGSWVYLGNINQSASRNDYILRSQILVEQQLHRKRSSPGVDIQEHNSKFKPTFPTQPGSRTSFPFAVGSVYWRGGYGREAEIIGSGGVTVSHGASGSTKSEVESRPKPVPAQVQSTPRQPIQERLVGERENPSYVVPFIYPQQNVQPTPQGIFNQSPTFGVDNSLNSFIDKKFLLDLAYT